MAKATLARLHKLALAIPRPGCDWEERPQFGPPASLEDIAKLERTAGFPLPADLRAFLTDAGAIIGMSVHNGYWVGGIEQLTRSIVRNDFPRSVSGESAAPVATDGGGNAFLLSASGRVWRWERETDSVSEVAASFAEFLMRVADDWGAFIAGTPGWKFLV